MTSDTSGEFVTLARIVKTQGRHGEVAVEVHTGIPDRFTEGMRLSALLADGARRELEIEHLWPHKNLLVLKFVGIDSMSDAETLLRSELQVPNAERAKLDEGWNFVSDLVGCAVLDQGREIGRIENVQFGAGEAPLFIVAGREGNEFEIPFAEAYLEAVDIAKKQVRMNLPEGMLDVNRPLTPEEKQQQSKTRSNVKARQKNRGGRANSKMQ